MRRFGRRKGAGFTELIDWRTPTTKDEIFACLFAHGSSTLYLSIDALKRWMGKDILQTILSNVAKEKVCITRMAECEQFGRERRDVAIAIKTDHCERGVGLGVNPVLGGGDMLNEPIYLTDKGRMLTGFPQC